MYAQQNFKYKDHLFVTGALRMDQSSVFGEDNRNQVYVKGSISYVLSSAEYWKKTNLSDWWDTFKLRAAYGQSGNLTGIGAYDRINAYNGQAFLGYTSLFSSFQLANENVKPERQDELEVGIDLGFLKNRLTLNKKINNYDYKKYFITRDRKIYFNLRLFVNNKFLRLGIPKINIDHINKDTYSDYKNFFSYRRSVHNNESDYGRCISVICRY